MCLDAITTHSGQSIPFGTHLGHYLQQGNLTNVDTLSAHVWSSDYMAIEVA
jgi:hypothetical protein